MKPWRRIDPTKNGVLTLPKECEEFLVQLPIAYSLTIWSIGATRVQLAEFDAAEGQAGELVFQGFKRGSFWHITALKTATNGLNPSGLASVSPRLVDAENFINFRVNTPGGTPADGVLTDMWR